MKPIPASDISEGVTALGEGLSGSVARSLSRSLSDTTAEIRKHLKAGRFEEAKTLVRELTFIGALDKTTATLRRFTRSTAIMGAGAVDSPATASIGKGTGYPFEIDVMAPRLMQQMIDRSLTRDTRRRMLERIGRAERFQKAADPIDPDKLANDINRFLRGEIRRVVDVSANVVGTRVSAYGMFYEARVRGIARYRIDAVLDDRTTDICREMNGKVFEVSTAYKRSQSLLSITEPSAIKSAAPFPSIDEVADKTPEELQVMGHDTPPFHFLCRTVVTLISTEDEVEVVSSPSTASKVQAAGAGLLGGGALISSLLDNVVSTAAQEIGETAGKLGVGLLTGPKGVLSIPAPPVLKALPGPLAPAAKEVFEGAKPGVPPDLDFFQQPDMTTSDIRDFQNANWSRIKASYGVASDADLNELLLDEEQLEIFYPETNSLRVYTTAAYRRFNGALRGNQPLSDTDQEHIKSLDTMLTQAPALGDSAEPLLVYRGASSSAADRLYETLDVGDTFQDDGYVSATISRNTANGFSAGGGVMLRIKVLDEAKKIYLEPLTTNPNEYEILMERSSQFRVVAKAEIDGRRTIDLIHIGVGERLEAEHLGLIDVPTPDGIKKKEDDEEKYAWSAVYLREALIRG